jgi:hypothetical protein
VDGHAARIVERRDVSREKPDGNKLLGRPIRRWEKYSKMIFSKRDGGAWTGFVWFRIGTNGRHLQMLL